jgi:two-component system sensor histidine kinase MprB
VRLTLRRRLTLSSALIVGATLVLGSLAAYVAVRATLRDQVDDQLRAQARLALRAAIAGPGPGRPFDVPAPGLGEGGPGGYVQAIDSDGSVLTLRGWDADVGVPVTGADLEVARGERGVLLEDRDADGEHLRVLTVPLAGGAMQVARSLGAVDAALGSLRWALLVLAGGGTLLAALLTRLFAGRVVAPIAEVTAAAGHIEQTGDLGRRLETAGDDEVGQMAQRFNAMLDALAGSNAALAASLERQRRLVADASHELRTPVTSLRTNLEVLRDAAAELPEADRRALLADLSAQAAELGVLVGDLMELSREGDAAAAAGLEEVRLDEVVEEALERARRHHPGATFAAELRPCVVRAAPDRLGRAVNNLLDNAATHGGGRVEVGVADGVLRVRDHGPGIPPAELPRIFDRFWRGAGARERPGSGLGLAIVEQVASASGGSAEALPAPGGGAELVLRLPAAGVEGGGGEPAGGGEAAAPREPAAAGEPEPPAPGSLWSR